jgi:hypothetical protein
MNEKSNKQKSMEAIPGEWKKLNSKGILEFQNITRILNRYYTAFTAEEKKTNTQKFREEISYSNPDNLEIFAKKFGVYEYLIYCEIQENNEKIKSDTWIHIDGIAEERDVFMKKEILSHPVYNIVCMLDIFKECETISDLKEMTV